MVAVAAFLPWGYSGKAGRSGLELARTADRLGVLDAPYLRAMVSSVALLPLLAAGAWTAAVLGRPVWVATLGALAGALAVTAAVVVWNTPLRPGAGLWVGGGSGIVALVGAAALAGRGRIRTHERPDRPEQPAD
jgi:hypothetical protein